MRAVNRRRRPDVFAIFNLGVQEMIILVVQALFLLAAPVIVLAVLYATGVLGNKRNTPEE
jgi:hypothetical protein